MKGQIFAFTGKGFALGERLLKILDRQGMSGELFGYGRFMEKKAPLDSYPLKEQVARVFYKENLLIFISAVGIALRLLAPLMKDKFEDPAVLCIDEGGRFVIPILSGHAGGANDHALTLASQLGAMPVLTTATDTRGVWAVDTFAIKNQLIITDRVMAKEISGALLEGESIGWSCDIPWEGSLPEGLLVSCSCRLGLTVSYQLPSREKTRKKEKILYLIPPILCLGVGCRRGMPPERMKEALEHFLSETKIDRRSIGCVASIDLKRDEEAVLCLMDSLKAAGKFFSAAKLLSAGEGFTSSDFVRSVTGVDNVCERAAYLVYPRILVPKTAMEGITFSLSLDTAYQLKF